MNKWVLFCLLIFQWSNSLAQTKFAIVNYDTIRANIKEQHFFENHPDNMQLEQLVKRIQTKCIPFYQKQQQWVVHIMQRMHLSPGEHELMVNYLKYLENEIVESEKDYERILEIKKQQSNLSATEFSKVIIKKVAIQNNVNLVLKRKQILYEDYNMVDLTNAILYEILNSMIPSKFEIFTQEGKELMIKIDERMNDFLTMNLEKYRKLDYENYKERFLNNE